MHQRDLIVRRRARAQDVGIRDGTVLDQSVTGGTILQCRKDVRSDVGLVGLVPDDGQDAQREYPTLLSDNHLCDPLTSHSST